ncbi:MAG: NADH-quinone oxidoreductase subunit J [Chloroflexota bacterium]
MTTTQMIFLATALLTLVAAIMVVSTRKLVHAALWLILALFGVAITFVLLEAGFFAVIQVVVYIGAIAILMIFAIMLTRREVRDVSPQTNRSWWLAAVITVLFFTGIVFMLSSWEGFSVNQPVAGVGVDTIDKLGQALVSPHAYVLPFEVASVLLLAAMIGAIYAAREKK